MRDRSQRLIISGNTFTACFSPNDGGALFELDYRPCSFNLCNTFTRKMEGYHRRLKHAGPGDAPQDESAPPQPPQQLIQVKEEGLQELLAYDWYERFSFIDHFLAEATTADSFRQARYMELGDFVGASYALSGLEKDPRTASVRFAFARDGMLHQDYSQLPVHIEKRFVLDDAAGTITAEYELTNKSDRNMPVWFGIEFNLTLLAGGDPQRFCLAHGQQFLMNACKDIAGLKEFSLRDTGRGLAVDFTITPEAAMWFFPIDTVSQSENGFERNYQGSAILVHWKGVIEKGANMHKTLRLHVSGDAGVSQP
jgi:alpha-amylase